MDMKKRMLQLSFALAVMLMAFNTQAQIQTPSASPTEEFKVRVGLTDIKVVYSRPSVKGRKVFAADGLQPYGKFWRVGANAPTQITFSDEVKLGGKAIPAGTYTLLAKPGKTEWTVMAFPFEGGQWQAYTEKEPAATWTLKPAMLKDKVETFRIDVNNVRDESADINLEWENTRITLPLELEVDSRVMASIEQAMAGPSVNEYWAAANYLNAKDRDLEKALEYVQKVTAVNKAYWSLRLESVLLGKLGKTKEAIKVAKASLAKAKEANDNAYIQMNEASIKEWSKM
jgi:hypothetical protein